MPFLEHSTPALTRSPREPSQRMPDTLKWLDVGGVRPTDRPGSYTP
jgi:hypothetical protein